MTEIHPLFNLTGRVAMVTGGGYGLGREFCDILAEFGADVVCPDLYPERAQETCDIIRKYGHKTLPLGVDVSKYDQVQALFQKTAETFSRLDILVNNAGITRPPTLIHQMDINDWHKVIDVNLHGVFYCMKEGLRMMMEQKKGSIINIASILGLNATPPELLATVHYAAAKSGVVGLTRQGAAEYGQFGIRVNCIAPGWYGGTRLSLDAGFRRSDEDKKAFDRIIIDRTPMKRRGYPYELKGLVLYLASDAASFMTGQTIALDDGWTSW